MKRKAFLILGLSLFGFSVALADINEGLVAYYPFEGNAQDASTNGLHGSNYTGGVTYSAGKLGQAAWFNGNSCLRLPMARLLDGESNATISAWVLLSGGEGQILSAGDSRSGFDPITTRISASAAADVKFNQTATNTQTFIGFDNGDPIQGMSAGVWHLFTVILERQTTQSVFRCYLDANAVKMSTNASFSRIAYDADMPAIVGALDASSPWQFWNGGIDDLRIYNRVLSKSEILYLVSGGDPTLSITVSQVRLCWNAPTNKASQLQYRSDFTGGNWSNLGPPIVEMGTILCATNDVDQPNKFYRVIFLP